MQAESFQGHVFTQTHNAVCTQRSGKEVRSHRAKTGAWWVHPAKLFRTSFSWPLSWPLDLRRQREFYPCKCFCLFWSACSASVSTHLTQHLPHLFTSAFLLAVEPFQPTVCHFYQPWGVLDWIRRPDCQRKKNAGAREAKGTTGRKPPLKGADPRADWEIKVITPLPWFMLSCRLSRCSFTRLPCLIQGTVIPGLSLQVSG